MRCSSSGLPSPARPRPKRPSPPSKIVDFGLYAATPTRRVPDPNLPGGEQGRAVGIRLLELTDVIPGQIGRFFEIRFRVHDAQLHGRELRVRIVHPRLTDPSGRSFTEGSRRVIALTAEREEVHRFGIEHAWEIAEGDWTFQVVHENRVLA